MKRIKNLYDEMCSFENLLLAANKAQRGKRARVAISSFNHRIESELVQLRKELKEQSYRPGQFRSFPIRDPKPRVISAAPYRDRVVHHALCNVIEPIFERSFINDSYASRKGKGTHAAIDRATHFMRNNDYALQCDIRHYFPSVDHSILKELIRRKIGCADTLWLVDTFIDHTNKLESIPEYFADDNLFTPFERKIGLPLGNQTSQFFANVYLNALDHYVKEQLGAKYYIRYVDDFVIFGDDKEWLWSVHDSVQAYLDKKLRLRLHAIGKTVYPVTLGVDFLGCVIFPAHRLLRRDNGYKFARRLRKMQGEYQRGEKDIKTISSCVAAWIGHAKHADTLGLRTALLENAVFSRA